MIRRRYYPHRNRRPAQRLKLFAIHGQMNYFVARIFARIPSRASFLSPSKLLTFADFVFGHTLWREAGFEDILSTG